MGCAGSTPKVDESSKKLRKPKPWKHTQPITPAELKQMCDEFWDTAPHYGGQKEIWDALRAAATEADLTLAQTIVDSAGIIVSNPDLTVCYDEREQVHREDFNAGEGAPILPLTLILWFTCCCNLLYFF